MKRITLPLLISLALMQSNVQCQRIHQQSSINAEKCEKTFCAIVDCSKRNATTLCPIECNKAVKSWKTGGDCGYTEIEERLVKFEGRNIKSTTEDKYEDCAKLCSEYRRCNSFSFCRVGSPNCHLKTKKVNRNEATKYKFSCSTFYKNKCNKQV